MIKYITSRPLWFNILVALGIIVIFFLIFMFSLKGITRHGDSKTVPAVTGKKLDKAEQLLEDADFELVIQDSVYYDSLPPGIVVHQFPEPDQVVKANRTVFVKINRFVAPDVNLPNINGATLRAAEMALEGAGLRRGDTTSRPSFAPGTVLEMLVDGKPMKPGDKVKMGTKIDLVVSSGLENENSMQVPNLVGRTLAEARILFEASGLTVEIIPIPGNATDLESAYITKQDPEQMTVDSRPVRIRSGQIVTVWLSKEPPVVDADTTGQPNPPQPR